MFDSDQPSYSHRIELTMAYDELIQRNLKKGWTLHYINFMFDHIRGNQNAKIDQMKSCVTSFHRKLTQHIVRKPESAAWKHLRPVFLGAPDLPVWKRIKVDSPLHQVNDGLHFNGILIMPPKNRFKAGRDQHPWFRKQSRLHVELEQHIDEKRVDYERGQPYRLHVLPITRDTMVDYALKTVKKRPHVLRSYLGSLKPVRPRTLRSSNLGSQARPPPKDRSRLNSKQFAARCPFQIAFEQHGWHWPTPS